MSQHLPSFVLSWARVQKAVSLFFMAATVLFPVYIFLTYRLSVLPVYDRAGNVIAHANYFLISLPFAAFCFLVGWLCYRAAQSALAGKRNANR